MSNAVVKPGSPLPISADELAKWQAEGKDFEVLDVRRAIARTEQGAELKGARWLDPAAWLDWKDSITKQKPVVVFCAKGHEIGQGLTTTLRVLGVDARYLEGGLKDWMAEGRPIEKI